MRLIDADVLLMELEKYSLCRGTSLGRHMGATDLVAEIVTRAPTVDAEPARHGHWIFKNNLASELVCSGCFEQFHIATWQHSKFLRCPSCGAKMDEEVGE